MKKRVKITIIIIVVVLLLIVIASGVFWYFMGKPLYEPWNGSGGKKSSSAFNASIATGQ